MTLLALGDCVVDRDADPDDRDKAVVTRIPDETATESEIQSLGKTVADVNPEYPAEAPVVEVAFARALDDAAPEWSRALQELTDEVRLRRYLANVTAGLPTYTYPRPRLQVIE